MNKNSVKLPIFVLFLLFLTSCQYFGKGDKIVLKEELSPGVEGIQKTYRKDKTLLTAIEHKDGERHGISRSYHEDGKTIYNEIKYNSGIKNGTTNSYYRNGQLYFTVEYVDGKREGICSKYYRTGELMAKVPYKGNIAQLGLVEYQKSGKKKTIYPHIIFEEIDKSAFENKFIVRIKLSKPNQKVKYFRIYDDVNGEEVESDRLIDHGGVVEIKYFVRENSYINETIKIRAEYKTFLSNPYVIYKEKKVDFRYN